MPLPSHRILPWILTLPVLCASAVNAAVDPSLLEGLAARSLGPAAVSGRISAFDAVQSDPNQIVVGAATGGVWISKNGGLTWNPVFDEQPVASIGAVAIDQANPDVIWVGTGEGNTRNSTSIGAGVFKSLDGGTTWRQMGLTGSERINRIALHPHNPDIAYVAALGTLWADNEERGDAVREVMRLRAEYSGFVRNSLRSLELMLPPHAKRVTDACPARDLILPLYLEGDHFKTPFCCYGNDVDCDRCGAWVVFAHAAKLPGPWDEVLPPDRPPTMLSQLLGRRAQR